MSLLDPHKPIKQTREAKFAIVLLKHMQLWAAIISFVVVILLLRELLLWLGLLEGAANFFAILGALGLICLIGWAIHARDGLRL